MTQYTTDADVQKFAQLVKDQGTDVLRRALEKEDKGRVAVSSAPLAIRSRSHANAYKVLTLSSPSLPNAICLSSSSITTDGRPIIPSVTHS